MRRSRRDVLVDQVTDVLDGLTARPLRTALLMLVFAVGTGGFVCAAGISQSAAYQVTSRLTPSDLDEVRLQARPPARLPDDAEGRVTAIREVVAAGTEQPVADGVVEVSVLPDVAGRQRETVAADVDVVSPGWLRVAGAVPRPAAAAELLAGPAADHVAVVGTRVAARLHLPPPGPGVRIWVHGTAFDVVGTVDDAPRGPGLADRVLLAPAAATAFAEPLTTSTTLVVRTRPAAAHAVADVVARAVAPDRPTSVAVAPVLDLADLRRGVATSLDRSVALLSGLLLALAALAIANAMVVSVIARRGEIGLRRALGASARSVGAHFLLEGAATGIGGGALGSTLGTAGVLAVAAAQDWTAVLSAGLVVLGPAIGVTVGLVTALYPARQAARVPPALAVRHE